MTDTWTLRIPFSARQQSEQEELLTKEWLVSNGLGGYASGTILGVSTRRYHSLLTAALPAPLGRQVMLNHISEMIRLPDGTGYRFGGSEWARGNLELHGAEYLREFRLEDGLPIWRYEAGGAVVEKSILMPHMQNTVHVHYRLLEGPECVRLTVRLALHFRPHDSSLNEPPLKPYTLVSRENRHEIHSDSDLPPLLLYFDNARAAMVVDPQRYRDMLYRLEEQRGYVALGDLWSPGHFRAELRIGQDATLIASTDSWDTVLALPYREALRSELERRSRLLTICNPQVRKGPARQLVLAADQFIICPVGRVEDAARARAVGDEVRTVIAGYHWFTDWGRDTMISLEGLTLTTGRHVEAGYILRTFGHYVRDGLIPNLFPEGGNEGLYHTADATLWFFHAIYRYLHVTGDRGTVRLLLPKLQEIVHRHLEGTRFGIGVDPKDGLLRQGQLHYQLTWMDAKVEDWVVTPRRGKAVEINALWYNALRVLENWLREEGDAEQAGQIAGHAERCRESFNRRFWNAEAGHLYDVVDGEEGDDLACRPNQILAISLPNPVLDERYWRPVFETVRERLLTPVGLRSLAPGHPDYKARYFGDLRARDAAYHQGTVWSWLIGPYIDAWLQIHPEDRAGAHAYLASMLDRHLSDACIGSISEIYDAEEPFTPRGCIAQAWGIAEALRCWALTCGEERASPA